MTLIYNKELKNGIKAEICQNLFVLLQIIVVIAISKDKLKQ